MPSHAMPCSWRFAIGALLAVLLVGCAGHAPQRVDTADTADAGVVHPFDSSVPVVQDAHAGKAYDAAEGRQLERRTGYLVDHSLHAPGVDQRIKFLVIHYTAVDDRESIRQLTGPQVSVHYLVLSQPGHYHGMPVVMQLTDEARRAWHAGKSAWAGREGLNDTSIGIEIVNLGIKHGPNGPLFLPFNESQIRLVKALASDIVTRYGIDPVNVVGHSDIAPGRKLDPGPFFPWQQLAQAGVGAWPDQAVVNRYWRQFENAGLPTMGQLQQGLARYGYQLAITHELDNATRTVLKSFQMHFRPTDYAGHYDAQSAAILFALLDKYKGPQAARSILGW